MPKLVTVRDLKRNITRQITLHTWNLLKNKGIYARVDAAPEQITPKTVKKSESEAAVVAESDIVNQMMKDSVEQQFKDAENQAVKQRKKPGPKPKNQQNQ